MNKQDYLIKKGRIAGPAIPAPTTLWVIKSTRSAVIMYETSIKEIINNGDVHRWLDDNMDVKRKTTYKRFKLDIEPFEINIYDDDNTGEKHGYGTGFGDLWGWSYLASPDKDKALKLYEDETIRVQTKYGLIF